MGKCEDVSENWEVPNGKGNTSKFPNLRRESSCNKGKFIINMMTQVIPTLIQSAIVHLQCEGVCQQAIKIENNEVTNNDL